MDGVLNNFGKDWEKNRFREEEIEDFYNLEPKYYDLVEEIDKEQVKVFNILVDNISKDFDVKIVMVSSWTNFLSVENFRELFKVVGVKGNVIRNLNGDDSRHSLVYDDANQNGHRDFIIIDDEYFGYKALPIYKHLVKTDASKGLTYEDIERLL